MKKFKDLVFEDRNEGLGFDTQAVMYFKNNYGVSVITGRSAYSNEEKPYEVAILYNNEITYSTPITDDVLGYNTEKDVSNIMIKVQKL